MGKQILVINSSPRKGGNTETMVDSLVLGIEEAGNNAVKISLREKDIRPCTGCYGCVGQKGGPCVQRDDMQEIYDAVQRSSTVVFASPLYWWSFNGPMKNCIDRLFAVAAAHGMKMPQKDCALLIAAEDSREENFALIKTYYQTCLVKALSWTNKGMLLAGGVNLVGDVNGTQYINLARELGASL